MIDQVKHCDDTEWIRLMVPLFIVNSEDGGSAALSSRSSWPNQTLWIQGEWKWERLSLRRVRSRWIVLIQSNNHNSLVPVWRAHVVFMADWWFVSPAGCCVTSRTLRRLAGRLNVRVVWLRYVVAAGFYKSPADPSLQIQAQILSTQTHEHSGGPFMTPGGPPPPPSGA